MKKIRVLVKFSRLGEYYGTVFVITSIGIFLTKSNINTTVLLVYAANLLSATFAFMINDIEDAPDDSLDSKKRLKNPISSMQLSYFTALAISFTTGVSSLLIYAYIGRAVFIIGATGVFLAYLYSFRRVRLKSIPVADFVSHGYFLGACYFLSSITINSNIPGIKLTLWFALLIFATSAISDLYNEVRDHAVDKKAGITNTTTKLNLGKYQAEISYTALLLIVVLFTSILYYADFYLKILLLVAGLVLTLNFFRLWFNNKRNIYAYDYKQGGMAAVGLLLLIANYL